MRGGESIQTFGEVTDKGAEIVCLLLLGLTHLHHISQVTPHFHQEAMPSVHLRKRGKEGERTRGIGRERGRVREAGRGRGRGRVETPYYAMRRILPLSQRSETEDP